MSSRPRALSSLALAALGVPLAGCAREPVRAPRAVTTIAPLAYVLREVVGARDEVVALLPPGASPHTFDPRPSDVRAAQAAPVLFFVAPTLDGWAARLPARRTVAVLDLVPAGARRSLAACEGTESRSAPAETDPHFWTDPLTVRATLPALARTLGALDAARAAEYQAHAERFATELAALDREVAATLGPLAGRQVILFHPSFCYLLARHGIVVAGVIELSPGKEPTARDVERLVARVRESGAAAIFTEPQLPRRPAEVVAEATGVRIAELDPLGGVAGRNDYAGLIRFNATAIAEALR